MQDARGWTKRRFQAGGKIVEDARIIQLFWERQESAIEQTRNKYGAYCRSIALRILNNNPDAEECVNDTYLAAWNAMPPQRPNVLSAFLGKITRNLSLKRYRASVAQKRGGGQVALSLDELEECVVGASGADDRLQAEELARLLNRFLACLPAEQRRIFMCRYWHFDSVAEIAARFGCSESKVKMTLKRTRQKLADHLGKEGENEPSAS